MRRAAGEHEPSAGAAASPPVGAGAGADVRGLSALESVANLQDLADRLRDLLGNPVTIEAADFRLIAYSSQSDSIDNARLLTILNKRVPESVVRVLWKSGVVKKLNASPGPVRVSGFDTVGLGSRVVAAIRAGDQVRGYIWVQETHRALSDDDLLMLRHAASVAAVEFLRLDQFRESHDRMVSEFLAELITVGTADPEAARQRAQRLGIQLPPVFRIVVSDVDDFQSMAGQPGIGEFTLDKLKRRLLRLIHDEALRLRLPTLALRQSDSVILLVGAGEAPHSPDGEVFLRALRTAAASQGYRLSVSGSGIYDDVTQLPEAYREALRCLKIGRSLGWTNFVVSRSTLGVLQLLPLLAEKCPSYGWRGGVHATVSRLLAEDQGHSGGFSLLETLEAYLDCAGDAQRTAERLCVHVNTLNYRLRRITERTGLNLGDGMERLAVHLELKLLRLSGDRAAGTAQAPAQTHRAER